MKNMSSCGNLTLDTLFARANATPCTAKTLCRASRPRQPELRLGWRLHDELIFHSEQDVHMAPVEYRLKKEAA